MLVSSSSVAVTGSGANPAEAARRINEKTLDLRVLNMGMAFMGLEWGE
jgi:hypothetical protein